VIPLVQGDASTLVGQGTTDRNSLGVMAQITKKAGPTYTSTAVPHWIKDDVIVIDGSDLTEISHTMGLNNEAVFG
jgi:hypothetical protein